MTTRTDIFGEVIPVDEAFEASLAEFVKTIEVNQVELREEKPAKQPKKLKIRPSMKPSDWDDCLN